MKTSYTSYSENSGSLNCVDLPNGYTFHYTIPKITSVNTTTDFIRKSAGLEKLSSSRWQIQANSNFSLGSSNLSLTTNTVHYFPWSGRLFGLIFKERSTEYPSLHNGGLSTSLSNKHSDPWKKHLVCTTQIIHQCLLSRQPSDFRMQFCVSPHFLTQNTKEMCTQRWRLNKTNFASFLLCVHGHEKNLMTLVHWVPCLNSY